MINVDVVCDYKLWSKKIKNHEIFFNTLVKFFPKKYKFIGKKMNLTILLSNNKNIKKLNKDFRNKNKPTDVLSFPFEKKFNPKKSKYLGDIVISYEFMNKPKNHPYLKKDLLLGLVFFSVKRKIKNNEKVKKLIIK